MQFIDVDMNGDKSCPGPWLSQEIVRVCIAGSQRCKQCKNRQ